MPFVGPSVEGNVVHSGSSEPNLRAALPAFGLSCCVVRPTQEEKWS